MIWRTADNVPEVYPAESRDFQLIGRVLDYVVNGVKFDIDSIRALSNTQDIMGSLLPLLQKKLGFFSKKDFTDDELREILTAFPYIMKHKGSKQAIEETLNLFIRLHCFDTQVAASSEVEIVTTDTSIYPAYTVVITLTLGPDYSETEILTNTHVLDEMFRYILPPSFDVKYIITTQ